MQPMAIPSVGGMAIQLITLFVALVPFSCPGNGVETQITKFVP